MGRFENKRLCRAGVANPNWSLGRIEKKSSKYQLFGRLLGRKITDFQSEFGPEKILFGPRVGQPFFKSFNDFIKID
jgi:hypothetical protein